MTLCDIYPKDSQSSVHKSYHGRDSAVTDIKTITLQMVIDFLGRKDVILQEQPEYGPSYAQSVALEVML